MTAPGKATYQDVIDAPPNMVAEVIYGNLVTHPRPRLRHAVTASALGGEMNLKFGRGDGGPGGWVVLNEPELHLGDDIIVPDIAAWRRERFADPGDAAFSIQPPDWVCEVLSPSTAALDRTAKLEIYAREHVQHAWLVDPESKTLEVFRLDAESWRLVRAWASDIKVRAEPFDAIELDLTHLWHF